MAGFLANFSNVIIPVIIFYIVAYGLINKVQVYEEFIGGAKEGLKTVAGILPTLIGLMVGVGVLRASGFMGFLGGLLGKNRNSGRHRSADAGKNVFFLSGNGTGAGYFQDPWNRFLYRYADLHPDELHRDHFLYDVGLLFGGKSDQNTLYAVGRADFHAGWAAGERCAGGDGNLRRGAYHFSPQVSWSYAKAFHA